MDTETARKRPRTDDNGRDTGTDRPDGIGGAPQQAAPNTTLSEFDSEEVTLVAAGGWEVQVHSYELK